jgi:hypothetical protein
MDPGSIAGLTLGAASLAIQVFDGIKTGRSAGVPLRLLGLVIKC